MKQFLANLAYSAIAVAFALPVFAVIFAVLVLITAYTVACLWQWFVPWLPPISMPHAVGIAMLVRALAPPVYVPINTRKDNWTNVSRAVLLPLGSLFIGYIVHTYFS